MEMSKNTGGREALYGLPELSHFPPRNAGTRHSGVDRQIIWAPIFLPRLDFRRPPERGNETRLMSGLEILLQQWSKNHDRSRDACSAQLDSLVDGCDAVSKGRKLLQRARDLLRSETVRIRLHHRDERRTRSIRERACVTD